MISINNLHNSGPEHSCDCNPDFAIICSFINVFGAKIDLQLNIEQLKNSIENQELLDDSLVDIHVKLFKKLRRYFVRDQWEKALIRFAREYSYEHAQEIEQLGYLKTRPSVKLELLRRLLDVQFECDPKFKAAVNLDEANDLRKQPVGRDIKGNSYWYCVDNDGNFRLFSEEPLEHKSWRLVGKSSQDLHELMTELEKIKDTKVKVERELEPKLMEYEITPITDSTCPINVASLSPNGIDDSVVKNEAESKLIKHETIPITNSTSPSSLARASPNGIGSIVECKTELKLIEHEIIPIANPTSPSSLARASPNGIGSIDSQVKQTLDSIVSKVVTSFDFFFRRSSDVHHQSEVIKLDHEEVSTKKEEEANVKPVKKRGGRREKAKAVEELPRRSSSRIQQLQQKKITNYFESAKKEHQPPKETAATTTTTSRPRAIRDEGQISTNTSNGHSKSKKRAKKDKQRWRAKGKKKLSWDKDDSDLSSISSVTDSNDESFLEEINDALNPDSSNNEDYDEFACEDEDNNNESVIVKRARTARQSIATDMNGTLNNSMMEEDKPCGRCDKSDDPEWILLCDMCDDGYHTTCCVPPLMFVPDGDWFCPSCEHKMLTGKLKDILTEIDAMLEAKERERQKRQRLRTKPPVQSEPKLNLDELAQVVEKKISEKRTRTKPPDLREPLAKQELDEMLYGMLDEGEAESESDNDIANSDESFKASSESEIDEDDEDEDDDDVVTEIDSEDDDVDEMTETEEEDVVDEMTETDEETDSSIDELIANFKVRTSRNKEKAKVKYFSETDEDDDY